MQVLYNAYNNPDPGIDSMQRLTFYYVNKKKNNEEKKNYWKRICRARSIFTM